MKKLSTTISAMLVSGAMYAGEIPQALIDSANLVASANPETTATNPAEASTWLPVAASIILGIYELAVRLFPTVKNYSILSWLISFLGVVVPNRKKDGGVHK
jgi:hypothetical protein